MVYNTIILGAGAAGMMCATQTQGALVIDHAKAAGEKIRISGGGRCNFTNIYASAENYISANPHFMKSALKRYSQWDFLDLVNQYGIAYHEKTLGQLFCDTSAKEIISMLLTEMEKANATLWLRTSVKSVQKRDTQFTVILEKDGQDVTVTCKNLVIATGGKSIPKMGATGLAYDIARQFDIPVTETRPGLVPLTFSDERFKPLAGVATPSRISAQGPSFAEALLFTHRGLSGPAILQASSYWCEGQDITVNLLPETAAFATLKEQRQIQGRRNFTTELSNHLPARLVEHLAQHYDLTGNLADWSDKRLDALEHSLQTWTLRPTGSEGYRTAEVTLGGIDTDALSSKTMESKSINGLYFIGEAVDVTGWLGGYNFQWAWSSGWAAGQALNN